MTRTEVLALLWTHRNAKGIEAWKRRVAKAGELESFGIGLTQLRKLAEEVGRDHALA